MPPKPQPAKILYVRQEEAATTVRGRIRFDEQLRRRYDQMLPIEIAYDEYTDDITPNRLIKAAMNRLAAMPIRSRMLRNELAAAHAPLAETVSLIRYAPGEVPNVEYDRLNSHYRDAVELSRLVLRSMSPEVAGGSSANRSFLLDMNKVFENFVIVALRHSLGLDPLEFLQGADVRLDEARVVRMKPDLSWWRSGECVFVGDVKYKRTDPEIAGKHADLYQLLAYVTALKLPRGLLIYAAGEAEDAAHLVKYGDRRLLVTTLDVGRSPESVLESIRELSDRLIEMTTVAVST